MSKKKKFIAPPGIPDRVEVYDRLDLHGFFPEQISEVVKAFIDNVLELQLKKVWIVHGKGKSRLKWEVCQVLKNCSSVSDFYDAPVESGGWGVTVVEL